MLQLYINIMQTAKDTQVAHANIKVNPQTVNYLCLVVFVGCHFIDYE